MSGWRLPSALRDRCARARRSILLMALGALTMAGAGCAPEQDIAFSFTDLGWSERIRPDLEPLDPGQRRQTLTRFSDGGPDGTTLVSPLHPDVPEVAAGQLLAAPTLWIRQGTSLRLSYEMIVFNPRFNGSPPGVTTDPYGSTVGSNPPLARQAAVSTRGATVPIDRRFLVVLGDGRQDILSANLIRRGLLGFGDELGVALESCVDGPARFDPSSPPDGLDRRCSRRLINDGFCSGTQFGATLFPATVLRCRFTPAMDTSFRLRVVDGRNTNRLGTDVVPNTRQPPLEVLPHVKVLTEPRALVRPAGFLREECRVPDGSGGERDCNETELAGLRQWRHCIGSPQRVPPGTTFARCPQTLEGRMGLSPRGFSAITGLWTFSVADPDTGRFQENFEPAIAMRRIRFLHASATRPNQRRYLRVIGDPATRDDIVELRAVITASDGARIADVSCPVGTEPGTGHAVAEIGSCPALFARATNPAWAVGNPDLPVEWRLVLRERAEDVPVGRFCNPNCQDVLAPGVLRRDLRLRPEAGDRLFIEFLVE